MEENYELVLLKSVDNDMEAEMSIVLLRSYGIEAIKKFKGSGSYLNISYGINYQGVELYVLKDQLDEAQGILSSIVAEEDQELEIEREIFQRTRKNKARLIVFGGMIIPIAILFIYYTRTSLIG